MLHVVVTASIRYYSIYGFNPNHTSIHAMNKGKVWY